MNTNKRTKRNPMQFHNEWEIRSNAGNVVSIFTPISILVDLLTNSFFSETLSLILLVHTSDQWMGFSH